MIRTIKHYLLLLLMFFGFTIMIWGIVTIAETYIGDASTLILLGIGMIIVGALFSNGGVIQTVKNFISTKVKK